MKSNCSKNKIAQNEVVLSTSEKTDLINRINFDSEMISLTDLWKAAGSPENKRPIIWQRQEGTQQLIETLCVMLQSDFKSLWKSRRGGNNPGTYAHKSLALTYAKYLDPKLHVLVNEVFFQRIEEEKNPDLAVDRAIKTYKKHGRSDKWISKRLESKGIRNAFTSTLAAHGVSKEGYRNCTNAIYQPLFGGSSNVVRQKYSIEKGKSIRDNLPLLEIQAISFSEALAADDIERNKRYGDAQCEISAHNAASTVREALINHKKTVNS